MCGIIGYVGQPNEGRWGQTHRLLEALFLASEHRGRHATGFVAKTEPFKRPDSGEVVSDKRPQPSSRYVHQSGSWRGLRHRRCTTVIGHVRWATHGVPEINRNNHPHNGRRGLSLVHNGVLVNHREVCERKGLILRTDCDSEAIIRLIETHQDPRYGLKDALRSFNGSMALALYDTVADATHLVRNDGRPLWLARLRNDRRWFFASTRQILLDAFDEVLGRNAAGQIELLFPLAAQQVHTLSNHGSLMASPAITKR